MTTEERCAKIIRLAEKAKGETDPRIIKQLMAEIHMLSSNIYLVLCESHFLREVAFLYFMDSSARPAYRNRQKNDYRR